MQNLRIDFSSKSVSRVKKKNVQKLDSMSRYHSISVSVQWGKNNRMSDPREFQKEKKKLNSTVQGEYALSYQFSKTIVLFTSRYDQLDDWLAMSKPQTEHPRQGQIRIQQSNGSVEIRGKKEKQKNPALQKQSQKIIIIQLFNKLFKLNKLSVSLFNFPYT